MQEMDESAIDSADTVGASLTDLENPLIFSIKNRVLNLDELLRHESIETTMQYVHLLPSDLREMYRGISGQ